MANTHQEALESCVNKGTPTLSKQVFWERGAYKLNEKVFEKSLFFVSRRYLNLSRPSALSTEPACSLMYDDMFFLTLVTWIRTLDRSRNNVLN
jgi:hypothetical protein